MRSSKITTALVAAGAALALAPAGAAARPLGHVPRVDPRPSTTPAGCHLSLYAEPHVATSGEKVELFGALVCRGGTPAGETVTLYEHAAGTPGFQTIGTATTVAGGAYVLAPSPTVTTDTTFYATSASSRRSAQRIVRVAPQVTAAGIGVSETTALRTGARNAVTFAGTVSPSDAGAEVLLEREQSTANEEWGFVQAHDYVEPNGTYTIIHRFLAPGDANLRVLVRPHGKFTERGVSNTMSYVISQTENPRFTINSETDPVSFGSPVKIFGTLAPTPAPGSGAHQKVALLGRLAGGAFTQIAETTTDGSGNYSFTVPAAQANTNYHVTSSLVKSSTVLFQGVKYILTAGISGTTVQAGQSLTWSGTVTPGVAGKVVYLERQNAGNGAGGYHVVEIAPVVTSGGPGSIGTYTLTHFIYGVGSQVYRVRVPGDPTNQAVSSAPVTVTVTSAPPGTLRPQRQSKLPQ
jgi:hypothetical protein